MRTKSVAVLASLAAIGGAGLTSLATSIQRADDPGKELAEQKIARMSDPAAQEAWMKTIEPGLAHEFLATFAGEWNITTRMWLDPSDPPQESKGTSTATMVFGGRYLKEEMNGEFFGEPFEGMGMSGYDNNRQLFVSTWCDSMGTGIFTSYGSIDESGKVLTYIGTMDEPMSGEIGKAVKMTLTRNDEDHHTFSMYEILYGDPFKVFEIEYSRK